MRVKNRQTGEQTDGQTERHKTDFNKFVSQNTLMGYAYDTALIVVAKHLENVELYSCEAISARPTLAKEKLNRSSSRNTIREKTFYTRIGGLSPFSSRSSNGYE